MFVTILIISYTLGFCAHVLESPYKIQHGHHRQPGDLMQGLFIYNLYIYIRLPPDNRGSSYNGWNVYCG
jgi:hypothetical protein